MSSNPRHLLLVTQVYLPDPASVGQHMADVGEEMVKRGWKVTVLTSARGYDNPDETFPARETIGGVNVVRLPFSSFGKKTILHRLVGQLMFVMLAFFKGVTTPGLTRILVTTSPPMGGIVGWLISLIRGTKFFYWVMDLNPDQAIAQGVVSATNPAVRLLDALNRQLLKRAEKIIPLDRFMAKRLTAKQPNCEHKLQVLPVWPMEDALERIQPERNPFIKKHQLEGHFVLMYSGNHSPVHPLQTFLDAAKLLKDDPKIKFLFVGGGKAKADVEALIAGPDNPGNVVSLPYQPLDEIKYSLSAADVHLVSMGQRMIGCVHPCKFYGAGALAKPLLYLGPRESHIGEFLKNVDAGWSVRHGEVDRAAELIREIADLPSEKLAAKGSRGLAAVRMSFSREKLCGEFCDILEGKVKKEHG